LAQRIRRWPAVPVLLALASPTFAAVALYMEPESLAGRAPLIVEARVTRTASGYDAETRALRTYVTLAVEHVHRGPAGLERVVLREPGGRFGRYVHDVDAVPRYEVGERVLAFLEPAPDGALRTMGLFFGKFTLETPERGPRLARRDLDGRGTILGLRTSDRVEEFALADLTATVANVAPLPVDRARGSIELMVQRYARERGWVATPGELPRLLWDDVSGFDVELDGEAPASSDAGRPGSLAPSRLAGGQTAHFVALEPSGPARWMQADHGRPVDFKVQPNGNPLGDTPEALRQLALAMQAWNEVPEARIELGIDDPSYDYTERHNQSPAAAYTGVNVILFDDPYNDISDPQDCGGVLAIGGYWRDSAVGTLVNNVRFSAMLQSYVVFNNDFECHLGDPDNMAEIAAHELGHGLGFGHSDVPDSIMRAWAYGGRGPLLGDDDRDAAHCHYPHRIRVTSPNGDELLRAGTVERITWETTADPGGDPGTVDVDLSLDGGRTWTRIATSTPNDGALDWRVPDSGTRMARVRVSRDNRMETAPAPYPVECTADVTDGVFSIAVRAMRPSASLPDRTADRPARRPWRR
jgi:hypothetical protein